VSLAVAGVLTEDEAARQLPRLREAVARAEDAVRAASLPEVDVTALLDTETSWDYWERRTVEDRRATLALGIAAIYARKAPRVGVRFDPAARLRILWVGDPD
jgi:hypothetical protein